MEMPLSVHWPRSSSVPQTPTPTYTHIPKRTEQEDEEGGYMGCFRSQFFVNKQPQPSLPLASPAHRPQLREAQAKSGGRPVLTPPPPGLSPLSMEERPPHQLHPKVLTGPLRQEATNCPSALCPSLGHWAPGRLVCTIQDRMDRFPGPPPGMSAPDLTPHSTQLLRSGLTNGPKASESVRSSSVGGEETGGVQGSSEGNADKRDTGPGPNYVLAPRLHPRPGEKRGPEPQLSSSSRLGSCGKNPEPFRLLGPLFYSLSLSLSARCRSKVCVSPGLPQQNCFFCNCLSSKPLLPRHHTDGREQSSTCEHSPHWTQGLQAHPDPETSTLTSHGLVLRDKEHTRAAFW